MTSKPLKGKRELTYNGTISHLVSSDELAAQEIVNKGAKDEE